MIDHVAAQRLAATRVDAALESADRTSLEDHLASCAGCRRVAEALGRDAETMRHLDLGPVPVAVRAHVAIAAEHGRTRGHVRRWVGVAVVATLLLVAIAGGPLGSGGGAAPVEPAGPAFAWRAARADITATAMQLVIAGTQVAGPGADAAIDADPGDAFYTTMGVTWPDGNEKRRLEFILARLDTGWAFKGIRLCCFGPTGGWLDGQGPIIGMPLGNGQLGDVALSLADGRRGGAVVADLRFRGMTVRVNDIANVPVPSTGLVKPPILEPPFANGGILHCAGILQMPPADAAVALAGFAWKLRWEVIVTGGGLDATVTLVDRPPDGVIIAEPRLGKDGTMTFQVARPGDRRAVGVPPPTDCAVDPAAPSPVSAVP